MFEQPVFVLPRKRQHMHTYARSTCTGKRDEGREWQYLRHAAQRNAVEKFCGVLFDRPTNQPAKRDRVVVAFLVSTNADVTTLICAEIKAQFSLCMRARPNIIPKVIYMQCGLMVCLVVVMMVECKMNKSSHDSGWVDEFRDTVTMCASMTVNGVGDVSA